MNKLTTSLRCNVLRGGNVAVILYCLGFHIFRLFNAMNCICCILSNFIASI